MTVSDPSGHVCRSSSHQDLAAAVHPTPGFPAPSSGCSGVGEASGLLEEKGLLRSPVTPAEVFPHFKMGEWR